MPPAPRPSIAPSKPVIPGRAAHRAEPDVGKAEAAGDVRQPPFAHVRDGQVDAAQFAARGERLDPLAQAARRQRRRQRGEVLDADRVRPRGRCDEVPVLAGERASRLAVRQGAPGRDNSKSVASTEIVVRVALHADIAGDARERLAGAGQAQVRELRLEPQARHARPVPRAETRIEPRPSGRHVKAVRQHRRPFTEVEVASLDARAPGRSASLSASSPPASASIVDRGAEVLGQVDAARSA